jgi:catechol 2,3-dioxygenase-like lactoylglutathione lyase family enzyme
VLGTIDHLGHLVRDLDVSVARARAAFGLPVARTLELPQFGISAVFLGEGSGTLELFTLEQEALRGPRLGDDEERLDHVAYRVEDIEAVVARLRAGGARFTTPDRVGEVPGALDMGPALHAWTRPETTAGLAIQLIQPHAL